MNESELKRHLVKSLRAQNGAGHRSEDKYRIGVPDLFLLPVGMPGGWYEVKLVHGAKLICTLAQERWLESYHRPPWALAAVIGFSARRDALYIGWPGTPLSACRYIPRPSALNSSNWLITELLLKWYHDQSLDVGRSLTYVRQPQTGEPYATEESRPIRQRSHGPRQPALHAPANEAASSRVLPHRPAHDGDHAPRRGRVLR